MVDNLPLLKSVREINQIGMDPIPENPLPICPRLIDLYATWLYRGGYKIYDIQTATVNYRRMMYRSFLSQLLESERQLTIFDEMQNTEFV